MGDPLASGPTAGPECRVGADNSKAAPAIDPAALYPGCPLPDYQRWRILPRLVRTDDLDLREPLFASAGPADLAATLAIVGRLRLALERAERRRLARHWAYAGTPHEALRQAHTAERWIQGEQEVAMGRTQSPPSPVDVASRRSR